MPEFGRLHPLLVHLPIGILLLAALFDGLSRQPRWSQLAPAVGLMYRIGAATAILSCLSGWALADSGEYEAITLSRHRWLGVATTAVSLAACILPRRGWWGALCVVLLALTGHLGGSMTHGPDYLFPQSNTPPDLSSIQPHSLAYAELVAPILQSRCTTCHGPSKQKGGLRLDTPEWITKGGKNGPVLIAGDASKSRLLQRCLLPLNDEEHMPPKQKSQPDALELKLIEWWINAGADFQKSMLALNAPEDLMRAIQQNSGPAKAPALTDENPPPAPPHVVAQLQSCGLSVRPLSAGSNYLQVGFYNCPQPHDSIFALLELLAPQLRVLHLSGCQIPDTAWPRLGKMKKVHSLHLSHTNLTDKGLTPLSGMTALQKLNLSCTSVGADGLIAVPGWPDLRQIYLYQTPAARGDWRALQTRFPLAKLDSGGYLLPFLPGDTLRLKG
ncbi:MAG: c-type cytochrome domain-containing protein [Saprospiraceae bacterium]|nr:c-type cytochrome domain-containing protein [Saprospiraceae bacterium]